MILPFDIIETKQDYVSVAGDSSTASRKGNHFHIPRIGYAMTLCHEGYISVAHTDAPATCPICLSELARYKDRGFCSLETWQKYYGKEIS
jgi:hypothetical protein